jgi:hypothetical protein
MLNVLEPKIERATKQGSDRSFGFVFAVALTALTFLPLLHHGAPRWWMLPLAAAFGALALGRPRLLHPFNRAWLMLGEALHRVVSPLVMGAIFFLCVTPIAFVMRWRGKDVLSLKRRPDLKSYWIERPDALPDPQAMRNQY